MRPTRKIYLIFGLVFVAAVATWTARYFFSRPVAVERMAEPQASTQVVVAENQSAPTPEQIFRSRYQLDQTPAATAAATQASQGRAGTIILNFRAIGLNQVSGDATADRTLAQNVLDEIHKSPLFGPETQFTGRMSDEETPGTFTFTIAARLKQPLKL